MSRYVLTAVLLVTLVCGCSSIQTMIEESPEADFDGYATWDWFPGERQKTGDPRIDDAKQMNERIRKAVERHMEDRGYVRSETSPQLYVDYHVTIQDEVNATVINNYYGESFYPEYQIALPGMQDTYQQGWTQGALLLLVFDANSKTMVWRGLAQTEVDTQGPQKEAREKIDKAVEKLLKKLPEASAIEG
jgi:hypothetical protein